MFPAPEVVAKAKGKVAAIVALCLFSFHAPAQDLILSRAPGMVIFEWQGDTIDTNALPAMYRLFGCDSACAIQRTAALIVATGSMKRSDEIDFRLKVELGGIGLNQYRWLRDFLMMCADDRKDWLGENRNRK